MGWRLDAIFFTILIYTTGVVNGQCSYPAEQLGEWWSNYNGIVTNTREYFTSSFTDSSVTYTCSEQESVPPLEYYVSDTTTTDHCSAEIRVGRTLFYSLTDTGVTDASPSDCAISGPWSPDVLVKYGTPFSVFDGGCDLRQGEFHLTYDETTLGEDNCLNDRNSRGQVNGDTLTANTCATEAPGYDTPYLGQLTCVSRINPGVFGGSATDGDILILGGSFSGVTRFYCARYLENATNFQLHFSLRKSPDSITCDITDTATTVGASHIHYTARSDDCDFSVCENNATCVQGFGSYSCVCVAGYTGTDCETDIDECATNPCENGGTCTDQVANYTCTCPTDYTGDNCEVPPPCLDYACENGGVCLVDGDGDPYCACNDSYTGDRCEIPPPCFTITCLNGGTCEENSLGLPVCQCPTGFTGLFCETPPPCYDYECENGGTCVESGSTASCTCPPTYLGEFCQDRECPDDHCDNDGQCYVTSSNQLACRCLPGYTGDTCEEDIDECVDNECENGAECDDGINSYTCICQDGYVGEYCQYTDPCLSDPCQDSQTCVILDRGSYTCEGPRESTEFNWVPIAITAGVLGAILLLILLICCLRCCSCSFTEWKEEIDDSASSITDCPSPKPKPKIIPQPIPEPIPEPIPAPLPEPEPIFVPCPVVDHCYSNAVFVPEEQYPRVLIGDCAPATGRVRGFVNGQPAKVVPRQSSVVIRELQEGEEVPNDCPVVVNCPPTLIRPPQERITIGPERRLYTQTTTGCRK